MTPQRGSAFGVRRSAFWFSVRGSRFLVLALACAAILAVSSVSRTVIAQTVDADAVYKANCATCHDQPTGRTPSKDALKERTADAILIAMTSGSMSIQALPLSVAERRALAEHPSRRPRRAPA